MFFNFPLCIQWLLNKYRPFSQETPVWTQTVISFTFMWDSSPNSIIQRISITYSTMNGKSSCDSWFKQEFFSIFPSAVKWKLWKNWKKWKCTLLFPLFVNIQIKFRDIKLNIFSWLSRGGGGRDCGWDTRVDEGELWLQWNIRVSYFLSLIVNQPLNDKLYDWYNYKLWHRKVK